MFWCCGKVDVIAPSAPSDKLNVDVAVVAKPIVLVSRAEFENQIVVVKKDEVEDAQARAQAEADLAEEEINQKTIVSIMSIALLFGVAYMLMTTKGDEVFYMDPPHEL